MDRYKWHVVCSGCQQKLRLTVTEKHEGHTLEAKCPKCHAVTATIIKISPSEGLVERTKEVLVQIMQEDPRLTQIAFDLDREGFVLALGLGYIPTGGEAVCSSWQVRVGSDGKVSSELFTDADQVELGKLGIKFED